MKGRLALLLIVVAPFVLGACSSGGSDEGAAAITEKPANFKAEEGGSQGGSSAAQSQARPGTAAPEGM